MTRPSMTSGAAHRMLLAGATFFALAGPALALDGVDLLAKINAVGQMRDRRFVADSIAVEGTTVTMKGVRLVWAEAGKEPLTMGPVRMVDVRQGPDGYRIGKIFFSDINESQHGERFTARDMVMTDLVIPDVSKPGTLDGMFNFDRFSGGPMRYTMDGKEMFRISGFALNFDISDDKSALGFDASVSDIYLDLTGVTDPHPQRIINGLVLQQLNGNFAVEGAWILDTGQLFQKYSIDVENVGSLAFDFSIAGYTPGFDDKIGNAIDDANKNPNQAAGQQALMASLMGYAQQLTYEGASIRFTDDGITRRMLAFIGSNQGIDADETATKMKKTMPLVLAGLKAPDLQKQIETAIGAYLDDPKNLRLSAVPAKPLLVPLIVGAAMGDPANLAKTINVQVVAND